VAIVVQPFNGLFFRATWLSRYQKGKTSLDLNEARDDGVLGWQWHQLDHMQTICISLQTDNHTNTSSLNFYRPDALPGAQPTVSKSLMCQQRKSDKVLIERVLQLFRFSHLKMRELLFPVLCPFFV